MYLTAETKQQRKEMETLHPYKSGWKVPYRVVMEINVRTRMSSFRNKIFRGNIPRECHLLKRFKTLGSDGIVMGIVSARTPPMMKTPRI